MSRNKKRAELKVNCDNCQAEILTRTAASTGKLCMPCFKANHRGRTPADLAYIATQNLGAIEERWQDFWDKRFPAGLGGTDVAGVCVSSLDTTVTGCLSAALSVSSDHTILDEARQDVLRFHLPDLEMVVEQLEGEHKVYFGDLLWMGKALLDVCGKT